MTCREFMEAAEFLTPSQLAGMQGENQPIAAHAHECRACGKWLESHLLLNSGLQALRSATAQREAAPRVEQAVLQVFRTQGFAPAAVVAPEQAAPGLWKLSRFFEFGAYAAVAAALIVEVFLGTRMLRDKQAAPPPIQAQKSAAPQAVGASDSGYDVPGKIASAESAEKPTHSNAGKASAVSPRQWARVAPANVAQTAAKTADNAGFVALMLCDPLICSGDEQVIRMELPAGATSADGNAAQPVIADVVIGDDGLVRAMRIVN